MYHYGHTNEDTAIEVDDYPWGFRLRTQQRYWIEGRKNFGQRMVTQTKNPKNGRWCKPKRGNYEGCIVIWENEKGHITYKGFGKHNAKEATVQAFLATHEDKVTDLQKEICKQAIAISRVMKKVVFEITPSHTGPVNLMSEDPEEKAKVDALIQERKDHDIQQRNEFKKIDKAINNVYQGLEI